MKPKHNVQQVLLQAYEAGAKIPLGEVALGSIIIHAEIDPLDLYSDPNAERTAYMYVVERHYKTVTKCLTFYSMSYLASLKPDTLVVIMTPKEDSK